MKNINKIMICFVVILTCSSTIRAQNYITSSRNNVVFDVPKRLKKIAQDGQKVVFEDRKTNSTLSFEKINTTVIGNLVQSQAQLDYVTCSSNNQNVDIEMTSREYLIGLGQVLDFNTMDENGNSISLGTRSILIDINGTLYRFSIIFDTNYRKAAYSLLNNFLDRSTPLYNVSSFRH